MTSAGRLGEGHDDGLHFPGRVGTISKHAAAFLLGTGFSLVAGYGFKVYVARVLGADALGLYAMGMSVIALGTTVATLGLPPTAARFVAVYATEGADRVVRLVRWMGIAVVTAAVVAAFGVVGTRRWIANVLYDEPSLEPYLLLFAVLVPLQSVSFLLSQTLRGLQEVARGVVVTNLVQLTVKIATTVGLVALGWALWGYVAAEVVAGVTATLLLGSTVVRRLRLRRVQEPFQAAAQKAASRVDREILVYARSMFGMAALGFLTGSADKVLLGFFLEAADVGVYSVVLTTGAFLPVVLSSVNSIFGPVIAELHAVGNTELLQRLFRTLAKWTAVLTWPLLAIVVVFSPELMAIFGASFERGWVALVIVAAGQFINVAVGSVGMMLLMSGRQRVVLRTQVFVAVTTVVLYLVLIPLLGIAGAALGYAAGLVLGNVVNLAYVRRYLQVLPHRRSHLRLVVSALASAAAALAVRLGAGSLGDVASILVALVVAAVVMLLVTVLVGLDDDDRLIGAAVRDRWRTARQNAGGTRP